MGAGLIDQFRDPALLVLPEGFYGSTRVDKQDAIIILPDEVREDHEDREPNIEGIRFPKYRYIEDLGSREGVQQFYFRHTGEPPAGAAPLRREDLWPRDDTLLDVVSRIVLGRYRLRHRHPCRPDLIDVGFDNEEYAAQAVERYWPDRPVFFTQYRATRSAIRRGDVVRSLEGRRGKYLSARHRVVVGRAARIRIICPCQVVRLLLVPLMLRADCRYAIRDDMDRALGMPFTIDLILLRQLVASSP